MPTELRSVLKKENLPIGEDLLKKLTSKYTREELALLAASGRVKYEPLRAPAPVVSFSGDRIRFAHVTDTHCGSVYFKEKLWDQCIRTIKDEKADFIIHTGDLTDGMCAAQQGKIFGELTHVGYHAMRRSAVEQFAKHPGPWFFVDGNHDRWFKNTQGALMGEDVVMMLKGSGIKAQFMGEDEGDVSLKGRAILKLWHGEDANSYAVSYRVQKLIESFMGGEKPHILCVGHTHKMLYGFERHIHYFSGGAMSTQSRWMRAKKIANHMGFWIIDAWVNKEGVSKVTGTFYPFYQ